VVGGRCDPVRPATGCGSADPPLPRETAARVDRKDRKELVKAIGEPDLAVPTESGAEELCRSCQSHQYFFETDFKRDIKTAVQID